jgi:hypothetical protein
MEVRKGKEVPSGQGAKAFGGIPKEVLILA